VDIPETAGLLQFISFSTSYNLVAESTRYRLWASTIGLVRLDVEITVMKSFDLVVYTGAAKRGFW
jgi:hypothetical protein